mmetsp:Transcript_3143/g.7335  ORF Transcript_3143/g.7335 Transcript_3143/m.7335 type:complete len:223 (-) Transcript_3143:395-1063(-)
MFTTTTLSCLQSPIPSRPLETKSDATCLLNALHFDFPFLVQGASAPFLKPLSESREAATLAFNTSRRLLVVGRRLPRLLFLLLFFLLFFRLVFRHHHIISRTDRVLLHLGLRARVCRVHLHLSGAPDHTWNSPGRWRWGWGIPGTHVVQFRARLHVQVDGFHVLLRLPDEATRIHALRTGENLREEPAPVCTTEVPDVLPRKKLVAGLREATLPARLAACGW